MFGAKLKKEINKPKHYNSKLNMAHLPGTGLRESEKHHVKMVLSSDLKRCLGWKTCSAKSDTFRCKWDSPCRTSCAWEHTEVFAGKWCSQELPWPFWEHRVHGDHTFTGTRGLLELPAEALACALGRSVLPWRTNGRNCFQASGDFMSNPPQLGFWFSFLPLKQ